MSHNARFVNLKEKNIMHLSIILGKNSVIADFSSSPQNVSSLVAKLPAWMMPYCYTTKSLHDLHIHLPIVVLNDFLPYGSSPLGFMYDSIAIALGDSVVERNCGAY